MPTAPVAMPSKSMQIPVQGPNTAAMGQMSEVMMHMKEVELQDNPLFMEITEMQTEEEGQYLN